METVVYSSLRHGTNFALACHHRRLASASFRPRSVVGRENIYYHGHCVRDTRRSGDYTLQEGQRRV